jgi:hypothetical protein
METEQRSQLAINGGRSFQETEQLYKAIKVYIHNRNYWHGRAKSRRKNQKEKRRSFAVQPSGYSFVTTEPRPFSAL